MTKPEVFTLSIETDEGTYVHGFHLGTIVRVAKQVAEDIWAKRIPKQGTCIKTVALMREGKSYVFDGEWSKEPK